MALGAALLILLTENIPLIISPSMDPIVAVLRSSYWLTIHVLTVTISYAAFSMAMLLGNIYYIKSFFKEQETELTNRFSHYAYRSIQLGVLLLTTGIILGGVWADYSWGRFWGWDPKETWALIADLGFIAILHGRFAGWITPKKLLLFSPLSYILVIMAWFGVNFILATGLHSYGFSTGGTFMVITAVLIQLIIFAIYFSKSMLYSKK
jgi:ABC-type transport system involved in cytochrome c biogenesis permease subunit